MTVPERSPVPTEANGFADDRRISSEDGGPEAVVKYEPPRSFFGAFCRPGGPTRRPRTGLKPHHAEIRSVLDYAHPFTSARLTETATM